MINIINRKICPPEEKNNLREYLSQTPVRWIVKVIGDGAKVSKEEIRKISEIGNLKTTWSNLGGISRKNEFLVKEVIAILNDPRCTDKKCREDIEEYKKLYGFNKLKLTITLIETNSDLMIIDGNKSAVACYEYGEEQSLECLNLPVYIITL